MAAFSGNDKETYVVKEHDKVIGFAILQMDGTFRGYIQTVCVAPERRGSGLGTAIIQFCEERIFSFSPNVFMCVSSFNTKAQTLYARLGYETIGELKDMFVPGYSEILLHKTIAPWSEFVSAN